MGDPRYLLTSNMSRIHQIDVETPHFWGTSRVGYGRPYISRMKKQHGDLVFDTFAEAKAELVRRHRRHLELAEALTGPGQSVTFDSVTQEVL